MNIQKLTLPEKSINAVGLAIIGAAIVLLIAGIAYYLQQERQRESIDKQTDTTNELIREVKALSQQNKALNQENRNFTYCNAVLFARWTQDQQPIVIKDLDKCVLESYDREDTRTDSQVQPQPSSQTPQNGSQTTNPATRSPQGTQSPQNPANPESPTSPQSPTPSNNLLEVGEVFQLDTPCLNVIGAVKTCQ